MVFSTALTMAPSAAQLGHACARDAKLDTVEQVVKLQAHVAPRRTRARMEATAPFTASTAAPSVGVLGRASARAKPAMKVQAARQPAYALHPRTRVKMGPTARSTAHNAAPSAEPPGHALAHAM